MFGSCETTTDESRDGLSDRQAIPDDWKERGFRYELWTDPTGQQSEDSTRATDEVVIVLEGHIEFRGTAGCITRNPAKSLDTRRCRPFGAEHGPHDSALVIWLGRESVTERTRWIGLVVSMFACLGAGSLGAVATTPEIEGWYRTIAKPSWNPPAYVFGPVWTTLFICMAIAAWVVWKPAGFRAAALPLMLFALQLLLNVAWSWIFFAAHQPGWAFVEIVFLWLAIAATMATFFRHSTLAGCLLIPYLAWVSFASVLNFVIWRMNAA